MDLGGVSASLQALSGAGPWHEAPSCAGGVRLAWRDFRAAGLSRWGAAQSDARQRQAEIQ